MKLAVREAESQALRRYLARRTPRVSSALARTEVVRALLPAGERAVQTGRAVLGRCELVRVTNAILDDAAVLRPTIVRSLDAIHLATAAAIRSDLGELVTYDDRMADAARAMGFRVRRPG